MQGGFPPALPPKPSALGLVALFLSAGLGLAFSSSGTGLVAVVVALVLGGITVVVAAVLAIIALARGGDHRTSAIVALVLGVLSLPAGAFAGFWGLLFAAGGGAHGRPFRAGTRAYRTPTAPGEAWSASGPIPDVSALAPEQRRALAEQWTADASLEHASIAAFSALSLDLLALGAPPSLVARAHRAATDEIAHAEDCFALASAYAGASLSAAAFPEVHASRPRESAAGCLRRLAVETAVDGCVGEATAAAVARDMQSTALDPVVAGVLARIARDEQSHADLAWDILHWCLARGDGNVLPSVLDALGPSTNEPKPLHDGAVHDLSAHGRASSSAWSEARARVRREVLARLARSRLVRPERGADSSSTLQ